MSRVLITGVRSYDFEDKDGRKIDGAKVSYLGEKSSVKQNETGFTPMQISVKKELLQELETIPGVYNLDFDMVPGKNNKPELAIVGFEFLKEVDIPSLFL